MATNGDIRPMSSNRPFLKSLDGNGKEVYDLTLYITGLTRRSTDAVRSVKDICGQYLEGRCDLKIVDLLQHPEMAKMDEIFAVPTLVKKNPGPKLKLIGDMSNRQKILSSLNLE